MAPNDTCGQKNREKMNGIYLSPPQSTLHVRGALLDYRRVGLGAGG